MSDIKWIYVTSANGKPVHLSDPHYNLSDLPGVDEKLMKDKYGVFDMDKEWFPIDIDKGMIDSGKPAKVPSDPFTQGMLQNGVLKEVDAPRKPREPKKQGA